MIVQRSLTAINASGASGFLTLTLSLTPQIKGRYGTMINRGMLEQREPHLKVVAVFAAVVAVIVIV